MRKKMTIVFICLALAATLLAACNNKTSKPETVTVSAASDTVTIGNTLQMSAAVKPDGVSQEVNWSVDNTDFATINTAGLLTGVAAGSVTVTAASKVNGVTGTKTITVAEAATGELTVTVSGSEEVVLGADATYTAAVVNANNTAVTWSVSDTGKASITQGGVLTANALGEVYVYATSQENEEKYGELKVQIVRPAITGITIGGATATANAGDTMQLTAAIAPANADAGIDWSISCEPAGIASVSNSGLVSFTGVGSVSVTATSKTVSSIKDTVGITVSSPAPVSINITAPETLEICDVYSLTASIAPQYALQTVKWSVESGDAQIDEDTGVLTIGGTTGTVVVKAVSAENGSVSATASITINQATVKYLYVYYNGADENKLHIFGGVYSGITNDSATWLPFTDVEGNSNFKRAVVDFSMFNSGKDIGNLNLPADNGGLIIGYTSGNTWYKDGGNKFVVTGQLNINLAAKAYEVWYISGTDTAYYSETGALIAANPADGAKVTAVENAITELFAVTEINGDISLPLAVTGAEGVSITWQSNNTDIITHGGVFTRPQTADATVELSYSYTAGAISKSGSVTVTVKSQKTLNNEAANDIETRITSSLGNLSAVTSNLVMESVINGIDITWTSDKTGIIALDGTVIIPSSTTQVTIGYSFTVGSGTAAIEVSRSLTVTVLAEFFTVKYSGTSLEDESIALTEAGAYVPAATLSNGDTAYFAGWSLTNGGTTPVAADDFAGATDGDEYILYPIFKDYIIVSFIPGNGLQGFTLKTTQESGSIVLPSESEYAAAEFLGWYDAAQSGNKITSLTGLTLSDSGRILHGYWDMYISYTKIGTSAEFAAFMNAAKNVNGKWVLTDNIDMTGVSLSGAQSAQNSAVIILDGNGFTVTGLSRALFNQIEGGAKITIKNIVFVGFAGSSQIIAQQIGYNTNSSVTLDNVIISGTTSAAGGLFGYANAGNELTIKNSYINLTLTSTGDSGVLAVTIQCTLNITDTYIKTEIKTASNTSGALAANIYNSTGELTNVFINANFTSASSSNYADSLNNTGKYTATNVVFVTNRTQFKRTVAGQTLKASLTRAEAEAFATAADNSIWSVEDDDEIHITVCGTVLPAVKEFFTIVYKDVDGNIIATDKIVIGSEYSFRTLNDEADVYFAGWSLDGSTVISKTDINTAKDAENTLTAVFESFLTVTFNYDGEISIIKAKPGESVTPPTVSKSGHNFAGWYTEENGAGDKITDFTNITSSIIIYAYFTEITDLYMVVLMDGSSQIGGDIAVEVGVVPNFENPADTADKKFVGWAETENGAVISTDDLALLFAGAAKDETITLYAVWKNIYTVKFNLNDGTTNAITVTVLDGQDITDTAGELPGFGAAESFLGWFTDAAGGTRVLLNDAVFTGISGNITLYAQYDSGIIDYSAYTAIGTKEQLKATIAGTLTGKYMLTADIDMTGETYAGAATLSGGIFDGRGYSIIGLNISGGYSGFFKEIGNGAIVRNVVFEDCILSGSNANGIVAASNIYATPSYTVKNVAVINLVINSASTGVKFGIVGQINTNIANTAQVFENCYFEWTFAASANNMMGVVGGHSNSGTGASISFTNVYIKATYTNTIDNGGAVCGYMASSNVTINMTNVYAEATYSVADGRNADIANASNTTLNAANVVLVSNRTAKAAAGATLTASIDESAKSSFATTANSIYTMIGGRLYIQVYNKIFTA